jgi:hypothetical protein
MYNGGMTTEAPNHYRLALDEATREYEQAMRQRAELDARIAHLAQTVGSLTRLCGLIPTVPWGLTEACRMVLKAAQHPLTATEVRAQLAAMGFDLSRYVNDLSSIHIVLKRLTQSGEAQFRSRGWEKPAYEWEASRASLSASELAGTSVAPPKSRKSRNKKKGGA